MKRTAESKRKAKRLPAPQPWLHSDGKKLKLIISFSGGETSGYMTWWCMHNWRDKFDIKVIFANTGDENEETLQFVENCAKAFGIDVIWLEAVPLVKINGCIVPITRDNYLQDWSGGVRSGYRVTSFVEACRNGEPFEAMVMKYGLPFTKRPFCSTYLKERCIDAYIADIGWQDAYMAIGIRSDEADRMSIERHKRKLLYPLINPHAITKPQINAWWATQPFRLTIKAYEGNCKGCWKKGFPQLMAIARDTPEKMSVMLRLEERYSHYAPAGGRIFKNKEKWKPVFPVYMFRGQRSAQSIMDASADFTGQVKDDGQVFDWQGDMFDQLPLDGESCDVFSMCGNDIPDDDV